MSESNFQRMQIAERRIALVTVITPFALVIASIVVFWGRGVSSLSLILCIAMYSITMCGITLGFHRLFTHRSFKCSPAIKFFLGISGCMAGQGPIYFWSACHRRHHQCSDREGDPHSPHAFGEGYFAAVRGWWHSHVGWMFSHTPENYRRLVPDLILDRQINFIDRYYFIWISLGVLIPGLIVGLFSRSWWGLLEGCYWGGLIRMFLVHHSTWSINSICHLFGSTPFRTKDESRNNLLCAILTFGEGWHNNHHAFPSSARQGLFWWQVDLMFVLLSILRPFGLVWDVVGPSHDQIEAALKREERSGTPLPLNKHPRSEKIPRSR